MSSEEIHEELSNKYVEYKPKICKIKEKEFSKKLQILFSF
jgi:hypothetical protein